MDTNKPITVASWALRVLFITLLLPPILYWSQFYDHFYAYLTGTIISRIITSQWQVVMISILFFVLLLIPLNYRRRAKWIDYGLGGAFFVSLFIEMYGVPLSILFASKYFFTPGVNLPDNVVEFTFFGAPMGMDLAMTYGAILMTLGIILIALGWWSLYRQSKKKSFASTGPYAISRHPQYLGFILLLLGWFVGWPTIITVIFSPILIYKYIKAARTEEKDAITAFGSEYEKYRKNTPFLI
ncbi:isoprenylcysteine carboxylmethyltransferase family protein [Candidatus Falkowbacteria bacterium]|nr:isoprenylcysteine carboxylmethyltransferase family protein [Candidatus Falkowbacteria bacterium]